VKANYKELQLNNLPRSNWAKGMCLAPFICSIDVGFFDEGTTTNNFAQIQKQYLLPMSLGICLSELANARYHEIGLLILIETS